MKKPGDAGLFLLLEERKCLAYWGFKEWGKINVDEELLLVRGRPRAPLGEGAPRTLPQTPPAPRGWPPLGTRLLVLLQ